MKLKHILLSSALIVANSIAHAEVPIISLDSTNTAESLNILLTIKNASKIQGVNIVGLDNFQIYGREVNFNTLSTSESNNVFTSKLFLAPVKAESSTVYANVTIDGKKYSSNKVVLFINQQQIDNYKQRQKSQIKANNKQMQVLQKQIDQQMKAQQQYFDNINKIMLQQQQDMQKAQEQLFKDLNN